MKKKYLKLTNDQKQRGVIFSSQLIPGGRLHEVLKDDKDSHKTIDRLLDDNLFRSHYDYNEIRM